MSKVNGNYYLWVLWNRGGNIVFAHVSQSVCRKCCPLNACTLWPLYSVVTKHGTVVLSESNWSLSQGQSSVEIHGLCFKCCPLNIIWPFCLIVTKLGIVVAHIVLIFRLCGQRSRSNLLYSSKVLFAQSFYYPIAG